MRLIGEFKDEKQSYSFQSYLKKEGIPSLYDSTQDAKGQTIFRLWIVEEDDFDKAASLLQEWEKAPQFEPIQEKIAVPVSSTRQSPAWRVKIVRQPRPTFSINNLIIVLCGLLFIFNTVQEAKMIKLQGEAAIELSLTPLEKTLLFDYPEYLVNLENFLKEYPVRKMAEIKELSSEGQAAFEKAKNAPTWKGVTDLLMKRSWKEYEELPAGTLFGKIRQGEIWRLISPVLLHGSLIHILFNMAWLWLLGRQIEPRIGILRYLLLTVIIGVVSNVSQYLMSGPEFLGYSGIVMGMVGFIWMRQKKAPWEGYPLQPIIVRFIVIYIAILFLLEMVSLGLDFFHVTELYANIANTAHIIGGLTGVLLARLPFFNRRSA